MMLMNWPTMPKMDVEPSMLNTGSPSLLRVTGNWRAWPTDQTLTFHSTLNTLERSWNTLTKSETKGIYPTLLSPRQDSPEAYLLSFAKRTPKILIDPPASS